MTIYVGFDKRMNSRILTGEGENVVVEEAYNSYFFDRSKGKREGQSMGLDSMISRIQGILWRKQFENREGNKNETN